MLLVTVLQQRLKLVKLNFSIAWLWKLYIFFKLREKNGILSHTCMQLQHNFLSSKDDSAAFMFNYKTSEYIPIPRFHFKE